MHPKRISPDLQPEEPDWWGRGFFSSCSRSGQITTPGYPRQGCGWMKALTVPESRYAVKLLIFRSQRLWINFATDAVTGWSVVTVGNFDTTASANSSTRLFIIGLARPASSARRSKFAGAMRSERYSPPSFIAIFGESSG